MTRLIQTARRLRCPVQPQRPRWAKQTESPNEKLDLSSSGNWRPRPRYRRWRNDEQVSISPTFYARFFCRNHFAKKSQSQSVIREKMLNLLSYAQNIGEIDDRCLSSISPTFYEQLIHTKLFCAAFLYLVCLCDIFCQKNWRKSSS